MTARRTFVEKPNHVNLAFTPLSMSPRRLDAMRIPFGILAGLVGYFIWTSSLSRLTQDIVEAVRL